MELSRPATIIRSINQLFSLICYEWRYLFEARLFERPHISSSKCVQNLAHFSRIFIFWPHSHLSRVAVADESTSLSPSCAVWHEGCLINSQPPFLAPQHLPPHFPSPSPPNSSRLSRSPFQECSFILKDQNKLEENHHLLALIFPGTIFC